jgi:hypothetical protein
MQRIMKERHLTELAVTQLDKTIVDKLDDTNNNKTLTRK